MTASFTRIAANVAVERPHAEDPIAEQVRAAVASEDVEPEVARALTAPAGAGAAPRGGQLEGFEDVWASIRDFFAGAKTTEVDRRSTSIRWPLFYLRCPKVPGASVGVSLGEDHSRERGWSIQLVGNGIERATTITVSETMAIEAAAGESLLLTVEHDVEVVSRRLSRRGHPDYDYRILTLLPGAASVGVTDMARADWPLAGNLELLKEILMKDAASAAFSWKQARTYEVTSDVVLGVEWEIVQLGGAQKHQVTTTVEMEATVSRGVDWELRAPERCPGLIASTL